ncbi:MAG TPA: SIS domain-containing protein [Solirubrobacteraceae bacterium]|nr:SIS domain-containing protein [Solirubrobacteraceae bacterium]
MPDASADGRRRLTALGIDPDAVARATGVLVTALRTGGKVLVFGNGGSAADAQHLAAELVGRFERVRPALAAIALTVDSSALTAIANDYGFEAVFARQIEALGRPGDVAIAISTSGESPNVVAGLRQARAQGMVTIGLCGRPGCSLCGLSDVAVAVTAASTAAVQEAHLVAEHAICRALESTLFGAGDDLSPCPRGSVVSLDALLALRPGWRAAGRTVVWTNGCFDVLHAGHLASLAAVRRLGDTVIVGVNDDASVRRLKGPGRPVVPVQDRAAVLAALRWVDYVVVFSQDTPEAVLAQLQPDIAAKGSDYEGPEGKPIPERALIEAYGGRVEFLPLLEGRSTTALLDAASDRSP